MVPESPPALATPLSRDHPRPAGPCAGWTVWGPAGDTGARRAEERGLAPAVSPSVCGRSRGCGNRSGAGSSGEAVGLLHLRVLLRVSPSFRPARLPHPLPRTPPSATSCLRGSGCPLTAPPYSPRTPAWPCRPKTTLVCLNALQWGPGPLQTSSPDPTWQLWAGTWCQLQPLPSPRPLALQPARLPGSQATCYVLTVTLTPTPPFLVEGFAGLSYRSFPGDLVKSPPPKEGDICLIPGSGKSPRARNGNPLQ